MEILSFYTCVPLMKIIWCMVLRYKAHQSVLLFWVIFCPLTLLTTWKIKMKKKWKKKKKKKIKKKLKKKKKKKSLEILSFYICTPQMTIIWSMVPDIWSTTDKGDILKKWNNHLEILLVYTCALQMTIIWYMVLETCSTTNFFLILDQFLPFYPLSNPENQNFEKMKKKTKKKLEISSFYTGVP